jgi:hypothetical protein
LTHRANHEFALPNGTTVKTCPAAFGFVSFVIFDLVFVNIDFQAIRSQVALR